MYPEWLTADIRTLKRALDAGWVSPMASDIVEATQLTDGQIEMLAYLVPAANAALIAKVEKFLK